MNIEDRDAYEDIIESVLGKYKLNISEYDVIIGYRADDSYFSYIIDFVSGLIYKETFDNALKLGNLGIQVFIKSESAFHQLNKISVEEVESDFRRLYKMRDSTARESYIKIRNNNKSARKKVRIYDLIGN